MGETNAALGPLVRSESCWVIGDAGRPGGCWLELRPEGLLRRVDGGEDELLPWARIMQVNAVVLGRGNPRTGWVTLRGLLGGVPGPYLGRGGGRLEMTVRHPYEDRKVTFDRHPRGYRLFELMLLQILLAQTVREDEAERLGDAEWLGRVVGRLHGTRAPRTRRRLLAEVDRARKS